MSETTTHSPESNEAPNLAGVPEALQLDTLDAVVEYRKTLKAEYEHQEDAGDYDVFKAQRVEEMLAENGLHSDESDAQATEDYERAKFLYGRLLDMNNAQWYGVAEGAERSEREDVAKWLSEQYADRAEAERAGVQQASEGGVSSENSPKPELGYEAKAALNEDLEGITAKYAELVAERSKRMIEGANTRKDIDAAKEELSDMLGGLATLLMDELEAEGVSWDDIPGQIDTFIAEQTDEVLQKMEAHRMEEYDNARPIMKKFYDKWAQWGEQGTKGKLKKAAAFALPGAAFGAALVPLAGVVGFGAVTGALAVTGARSVGRRLAGAHLDKRADAKKVAQAQREDIRGEIDAVENAAHTDILAIIDERSEVYRKQNLRRTAGGLAIALSVGLLTAKGADILADNVDNWSFGKLGELGKSDVDAPEGGNDIVKPDMDGDGTPDALDRDRDGDGVNNGRDYAPNDPNVSEAPVSTRDQLFDGRFGARELTSEGRAALAEQLNGYTVKPGDSVWSLSEQFLADQGIQNPTVYEIDATKDMLLGELRASGDVDSRGWLSVGDKIHIK